MYNNKCRVFVYHLDNALIVLSKIQTEIHLRIVYQPIYVEIQNTAYLKTFLFIMESHHPKA